MNIHICMYLCVCVCVCVCMYIHTYVCHMKQNFNRTQKYKVIAFNKNKKRLLRTLQGGGGLGLVLL
jgi:hypothetical protein